jgi:hypothetical protein
MTDLSVSVNFQDTRRLSYTLPRSSTVSDLLVCVQSDSRAPSPPDRVAQFIFLGHILRPDQCLGDLSPSPEFTVQCFWRGAAPPAPVAVDHPADRGFDRLSRVGYSPEQIADMRRIFHRLQRTADVERGAQLALEDDWVPAVTVAGSPIAAIRLMQTTAGHDDETRLEEVRTLQPPGAAETEWESPLLAQEEEGAAKQPADKETWTWFIVGVIIGILLGKGFWLIVPFTCIRPVFSVGLGFGMMLRAVVVRS